MDNLMLLLTVGLVSLGLGVSLGVYYFRYDFESELDDRLDALISEYSVEINEHFKENGWNLGAGYYREDIFNGLFGELVYERIDREITKKTDSKVVFKEGMIQYEKNSGYQPMYFDTYTGETIVVENATTDKSYLGEYTEENGYLELGAL